jgi:NhaA family Na+:H+ antiporter
VFFLIVPIFAFANAGINIAQTLASTGLLTNPVVLGIFFGLLIGNPIGINLIIYITTRLGIVKLPAHVLGVSFLAGVGFTMSYFIAGLAFIDDLQILNISRFVILISSTMAGVIGFLILFFSPKLSRTST